MKTRVEIISLLSQHKDELAKKFKGDKWAIIRTIKLYQKRAKTEPHIREAVEKKRGGGRGWMQNIWSSL